MIIVLKFGEIIVSGYDAVRKGSLRRVSLKSGRVWRRLVLHSNHDCLSFYKDVKVFLVIAPFSLIVQMEKPFPKMKRLTIANIEDADSADADEEQEFVLKLKLKDDPDKPCFLGFATKADRDKLHGELKTIQKGLRYARELDQCRLK